MRKTQKERAFVWPQNGARNQIMRQIWAKLTLDWVQLCIFYGNRIKLKPNHSQLTVHLTVSLPSALQHLDASSCQIRIKVGDAKGNT